MNLKPTICNICGGHVIYTSNKVVYGKEYGNGKCYFCMDCKAYVGTHKNNPKVALGILANKQMREMKIKCHDLFDKKWNNESSSKKRYIARQMAYQSMAKALNIPVSECHFGYFDMDMLNKAYKYLKGERI